MKKSRTNKQFINNFGNKHEFLNENIPKYHTHFKILFEISLFFLRNLKLKYDNEPRTPTVFTRHNFSIKSNPPKKIPGYATVSSSRYIVRETILLLIFYKNYYNIEKNKNNWITGVHSIYFKDIVRIWVKGNFSQKLFAAWSSFILL